MSESVSEIVNATGKVKWFDARKGFGFIIGPEGQDVFAHFTIIHGLGFRILKDGWTVTYDAHLTPRGWHATRVELPPGALSAARPARPGPNPSGPLDTHAEAKGETDQTSEFAQARDAENSHAVANEHDGDAPAPEVSVVIPPLKNRLAT